MIIFECEDDQAKLIKEVSDKYEFFKAILESQCWETKGGKVVLNFDAHGILINIQRPRMEFGEMLWERKKKTA